MINPFAPRALNLATPTMFDPDQAVEDMTTSAQDVVDDQNQDNEPEVEEVDAKRKKINDEFRQRITVSKQYRRKLIANWTVNVDYRRGKPFSSQIDEDQIAVNLDWALTKAKVATLFSQVPKARVNHGEDLLQKVAPWTVAFEKKLNDTLVTAGIEAAMEECLPDCINAAGFGAVLVAYDAITEDVEVPLDPANPDAGTTIVPRVLDQRYLIKRISPSDFLWPIDFTGSDFDQAPWIGRTGRMTWASAVKNLGLKPEDKQAVLGEDQPMMDKLVHDVEKDKSLADDQVPFDEIFYKEHDYDVDGTSFAVLRHLIFVGGKEEPVVDEPWKGQKLGPDGKVIGAQSYPIKVLTLGYLTDEPIPPSDSAIGRPQVNEINKIRTQMIRQRERSLPIRWFDVNRIDPAVQQGLMRGTWQTMIPVQGDGDRTIGEVARSAFPPENKEFDATAKADLMAEWTMGSAQLGAGTDVETKGESDAIQSNIQLPHNRERSKVASFIVDIAQVLSGLLCLFEDPALFGQGFEPAVSSTLAFSVLADSTVLLDSNQKLSRLNQFVNQYAKSGWVNLEPVLQEIAQLSGLDPSAVIVAPKPKPPAEPNISLRLTGVEDLLNPLALAFLINSGQAPSDEQIEQAKQKIQQAVVPPQGLQLQPGSDMGAGAPMLPIGAPLVPPSPAPLPGSPTPPPPPPAVGEANEEMSSMPKITERSEIGGKQ